MARMLLITADRVATSSLYRTVSLRVRRFATCRNNRRVPVSETVEAPVTLVGSYVAQSQVRVVIESRAYMTTRVRMESRFDRFRPDL